MKTQTLKDIISHKMTLIVSLPENSRDNALAAEEAGADAIKVHVNCHHRASGTLFGSWQEEQKIIAGIPALLGIPVGIVPGAETVASMEEMQEIRQCGFDFLDIFSHHMPPPYFGIEGMGKAVAIDYTFPLDYVPELVGTGVDIIEASIINPQGYGERLTARDLAYYRTLTSKASCPVFIPTQRKIDAGELYWLHQAGARGIAIGAVVTGKDRQGIVETTRRFRKALDQINSTAAVPSVS